MQIAGRVADSEVSKGVKGQPRIDIWRIGTSMLLALILPVCAAIVVDIATGWWPLVTLVAAGFTFPIAGILVIRTTMQELEKVISELAPADQDESDSPEDETTDTTVPDRSR